MPQGPLHLTADGGKHIHLHGLGDREGDGVFLAPHVPEIEADLPALRPDEGQRFLGRGGGESEAGLGGELGHFFG